VRVDATTVCPKCRQLFSVGPRQVRPLREPETPAQDATPPAEAPVEAHEAPPDIPPPHELLHPSEAQAAEPEAPWHRRLLWRLGLSRGGEPESTTRD